MSSSVGQFEGVSRHRIRGFRSAVDVEQTDSAEQLFRGRSCRGIDDHVTAGFPPDDAVAEVEGAGFRHDGGTLGQEGRQTQPDDLYVSHHFAELFVHQAESLWVGNGVFTREIYLLMVFFNFFMDEMLAD